MLVDDLVISDAAFTFAAQIQSLRFKIEERLQNAAGRIDFRCHERFANVMLIPNGILAIRVLGKAGRQDSAVVQKDDFRLLGTIVCQSLRHYNASPRLDDAQKFILRGRCNVRPFAIDCQAVDLIDVTIDNFEDAISIQWRWCNVPHDDQVVEARTDEHIVGRRVPFKLCYLPAMAEQLVRKLRKAWSQSTLGDIPDFDRAIITGWRNLIIVEWIPLQVENLPTVADDFASLEIDATGVVQRDDDERCVGFDGQENRIHSANITVMAITMDGDVRVALFLRRPIDMTKLRRANATEPKLKGNLSSVDLRKYATKVQQEEAKQFIPASHLSFQQSIINKVLIA